MNHPWKRSGRVVGSLVITVCLMLGVVWLLGHLLVAVYPGQNIAKQDGVSDSSLTQVSNSQSDSDGNSDGLGSGESESTASDAGSGSRGPDASWESDTEQDGTHTASTDVMGIRDTNPLPDLTDEDVGSGDSGANEFQLGGTGSISEPDENNTLADELINLDTEIEHSGPVEAGATQTMKPVNPLATTDDPAPLPPGQTDDGWDAPDSALSQSDFGGSGEVGGSGPGTALEAATTPGSTTTTPGSTTTTPETTTTTPETTTRQPIASQPAPATSATQNGSASRQGGGVSVDEAGVNTKTSTKTFPARTWTSSDGREVQARFMSSDGRAVVLSVRGKLYRVQLSRLSQKDRDYVRTVNP